MYFAQAKGTPSAKQALANAYASISITSQAKPAAPVSKRSPVPQTPSGSSWNTAGNESIAGSVSNGVSPSAKPRPVTSISRCTNFRQAITLPVAKVRLPAVPKLTTRLGSAPWARNSDSRRAKLSAALTLPSPVYSTGTSARSNRPCPSSSRAITTRGSSSAIIDHRARGKIAPGEVLHQPNVDQHSDTGHAVARELTKRSCREQGAASRQHVVNQQQAPSAGLHFEHTRAVFQVVSNVDHGWGQFSLLAHGHEALAAQDGQSCGHDEAARFDARHRVEASPLRGAEQAIERAHGVGEMRAQQRTNVAKQDAGAGKVGHVDDEARKLVHCGKLATTRTTVEGSTWAAAEAE